MKKTLVIALAVVFALTCLSVAACAKPSVRVILHDASDSPRIAMHTIGEDDLSAIGGEGQTFKGWFCDKELTLPFKITDEIADGTHLYAKFEAAVNNEGGNQGNQGNQGGNADKVTLTLDPNYAGAALTNIELDKNATYKLPNVTQTGFTFAGWFTQVTDGIQWTDTTPVSENTTLYAHWTQNNQGGNTDPQPVDLSATLSKYSDTANWNFAVTVEVNSGSKITYDYNEYLGDTVMNKPEGANGSIAVYYDMSDSSMWYYYGLNSDGTYSKYDETTDQYDEAYTYSTVIDLYTIANYAFVQSGDGYAAQDPNTVGKEIFGDYGIAWTSFTLYISNGSIGKLVGVLSDGWIYTHTFSKYGEVNFSLPQVSGGGTITTPAEPTDTMENQIYNPSEFDNENLQKKLLDSDGAIGLPSIGTYNALVIPVQFQGDTITQTQLNNLNAAFNGTSEQTGWESVKTYYQKSSYGKLNITFDIQNVYQAQYNSSYYEQYNQKITSTYTRYGDEAILMEALAYYESRIDLTKYDINNDGCIDAVYLIYSASVDYSDDSFYWAYVTRCVDEKKYDGLDAYYYLFAGFDFMNEDVNENSTVKINAETYIHETGHLLGLDDYYDYETGQGCNQGLGGADMMDFNKGDHGVYSKLMLGWLTPTIVTSTQTITINSLQQEGAAILIPLNFNNSYFCEYLLVDLYSAKGLNELNASLGANETILYGGAKYGVRIYHVSSSASDPYNNDYQSFTDYNNSTTNIPLIKLVEADGQTSTSTKSKGGWASGSDLWQQGNTLSGAFPKYTRNDGKALNFDIRIDSVSADSATITVTFNTTAAAA